MLKLKGITKDYVTGGNVVHALRGVDLCFRKNEFVSILGASGCGKTTMLNIIGGLDHYTSGDLIIGGVSTKKYKDRDWDTYRNHRIGFVFQSYNLIPHQTVLANVELALTIAGLSKKERRRRAEEALDRVGLHAEKRKRPNQLSGGQMQRVAIARALVNNPEILLADEPTGALDTVTSVQIMELIREIAGERLVIMVTHNPELAEQYSTRIVRLQDGLVVSDSNPCLGDGKEIVEVPVSERDTENKQTVKRVNKEVVCPVCGKKQTVETDEKGGVVICGACGKAFKVQVKTRYFKKELVQTDEKAQMQNPKKGKKKRTSMSFFTSLGLSARNLLTKKGRTAITSIAGSIGIISVCLVLALSNGFNGYILKTQEDMLSSSPLEITETTLDMTAIITGMAEAGDMPELDKIGDKVYVNSFLTNIAQGMTVTNDLSDEYLKYLESMDESWYTALVYDTGMVLNHNLFTEVEIEDETSGSTQKAVMSLSELKAYYTLKLTQQEEKYANLAPLVDYLGAIFGKMPGTKDVNSPEFGDYVLSQYEIVGEKGYFPTKANEAVLVVGGNNDMTDLTLAQLGFIGEEEFLSLFPTGDETAEDLEDLMIPFDEIIGKKFMLNYNNGVYTQNTGLSKEYIYEYTGRRASLGTTDENGTEITITGVLRLKDGMNYGCLGTGGLYLTEALCAQFQEKNMDSEIAKTLRTQSEKVQQLYAYMNELSEMEMPNDPTAPDYQEKLQAYQQAYAQKVQEFAIFLQTNAQYFRRAASTLDKYYMSGSSLAQNGGGETGGAPSNPMEEQFKQWFANTYFIYGDSAIRSVGGKDKVNAIKIYTDSFDAKEEVLAYLDAWNDSHEKATQVQYTDTVGMMLTMVETILDAITYVLVAFTAISLVVSSVMIGIITYVSVVERTKEIGVLRSLGARKKDVKNLFNAETFIIGLTSGAFGVAVTYALQVAINAILVSLTGIVNLASLPIKSAIIMVCVSIILTLISGLIPARAAAKKDPVIALRTE